MAESREVAMVVDAREVRRLVEKLAESERVACVGGPRRRLEEGRVEAERGGGGTGTGSALTEGLARR